MTVENNLPFDPVHIFECGQCFRWNADSDGVYTGIADGRVCRVCGREIICDKADEEYFKNYFALDTDYGEICAFLEKCDEKIKPCTKFGCGIRILKQNLWETVVSFIISANNNIPRIKKIIENMCSMFGNEILFEGKKYYSFPSADALAKLEPVDLAPLKAGYRDKYIIDAARKVASGEVNLSEVCDMSDKDAKKALMKIKGVGGKVADCIMLFSLGRFSVFPTDVWIKRILTCQYGVEDKEIQAFVANKYGKYAGFAQQYLYYYYRSNPEI